jgi:hypothetical protein
MASAERAIGQLPIQLGAVATNLKNRLEARFAKSITFSLNSGIREHAAAFLSDGNSPNVQFRSESDINETTVIHEFHHLQLLADGFFVYELTLDPVAVHSHTTFDRLYQAVRAAFQHAMFFPLMRDQGMDPTSDLRLVLDSKKLAPRGRRQRDLSDFEYAVDLFAAIMSGDELASGRFRKLLLDQGWDFSVQKADALHAIAQSVRFDEPQGEAEAVVSALNTLFDGQFEFSLSLPRCHSKEESWYQANIAQIRITFRNNPVALCRT